MKTQVPSPQGASKAICLPSGDQRGVPVLSVELIWTGGTVD
jgi:hypothetical protein